MTGTVFALVLLSSVLHASWNFAARKVEGNLVVMWLAPAVVGTVLAPFALWLAYQSPTPVIASSTGNIYIVVSGVVHALYYLFLAHTYQHGEISVVYPIARGSGIAATALLGWMLLGETVSFLGAAGVAAVSAGILSMSVPSLRQHRERRGIVLALCVGATIVTYSIVDKKGVEFVKPVVYLCISELLTAAVMFPYVYRKCRTEFVATAKRYWRYGLGIGVFAAISYLLILYAFTMGPVGYIVACREISVAFGAFLGIVILKERLTVAKSIAIVLIVIGLLLVKIA